MIDLVERLLRLWAERPLEGADAVTALRQVYADPVLLNGTHIRVQELVDRVDTPDRVAIVHRLRGRHIGRLVTPLGAVAPTGRMVESLTIDVLGITDGLVSQIWVVGDELGRLMQLGAVSLAQPPHDLARGRARR